MSAWVKFKTPVPQPLERGYLGFEMSSTEYRHDWLNDMVQNEWKWVSEVRKVVYTGSHIFSFKFDDVDQYTEVLLADPQLEVWDVMPDPRPYD